MATDAERRLLYAWSIYDLLMLPLLLSTRQPVHRILLILLLANACVRSTGATNEATVDLGINASGLSTQIRLC